MKDELQFSPLAEDGTKVGAGETASAGAPRANETASAGAPREMEAASAVSRGEMETAVAPATVGQRLRAAREAAHLSVAEVADSIKFSPRQIELLEADDYAGLPGATIVRGFVRSYARLLKQDAVLLLHVLDADTPIAPAEVRAPGNMGVANEPGKRQWSPLISATLVLALAALLLGLWHFLVPPLATETVVSAGSRLWSAPRALLSPAPEAEPVPAATAPAVATPESRAVVPPEAAPAPAEAGSTPAAVGAAVGEITLQFVFHGRSWVEVGDVTRQKLHSAENPAGSRLTLTGRPPFDIVIGNAGKVALIYAGRPIDLAPYTRAEVARLTLE
ncbi:MAG: helix-turn-helix domain-containing protein [Rhodocyclaceae bacterium]|nr:helix-turn-helix domain-containing protein [Rhodocyclaceae bacterium]